MDNDSAEVTSSGRWFHVRGLITRRARLVGDGCQLNWRHCQTVGRTERSAGRQVIHAFSVRSVDRLIDVWPLSVDQEVKVSSPDYQTVDKDQAMEDFKERISVYERQYCTLDEEHDKNLSFIKIFNQGERYLINNIHGTSPSFMSSFVWA